MPGNKPEKDKEGQAGEPLEAKEPKVAPLSLKETRTGVPPQFEPAAQGLNQVLPPKVIVEVSGDVNIKFDLPTFIVVKRG